jgi:hypothetical protein
VPTPAHSFTHFSRCHCAPTLATAVHHPPTAATAARLPPLPIRQQRCPHGSAAHPHTLSLQPGPSAAQPVSPTGRECRSLRRWASVSSTPGSSTPAWAHSSNLAARLLDDWPSASTVTGPHRPASFVSATTPSHLFVNGKFELCLI